MRFQPKTEEELSREGLLAPSDYDFEVARATEEVSKNTGADMIKLQLRIYVGESERTIFDYLVAGVEYKIKHFCESVGLDDKYSTGSLTAHDCEGTSGRCKVIVQKGTNGYPDKNAVRDYIPTVKPEKTTRSASASRGSSSVTVADDLPF